VKPLIAAAAAFILMAAAAIAFVLTWHDSTGPDAFAGAYPLVTAAPTGQPALTWRPAGTLAGPLPAFHGNGSPVVGRTVNRVAGLSYARFGAPWKPAPRAIDGTTGQQFGSKTTVGLERFWYASLSVGPLDPRFAVPGPQRLRAAAELTGRQFVNELYREDGDRRDLAGAAMTVDHHAAWVTAFRMTHTDGARRVEKAQNEVVVAVDTGRRLPAVVEITIPGNQSSRLPDVNRLVRSLRVVA
jgi:hypothetical protein